MQRAPLRFLIGAGDGELRPSFVIAPGELDGFERLDDDPALRDEPIGAADFLVDRLLVVLVNLIGAIQLSRALAINRNRQSLHLSLLLARLSAAKEGAGFAAIEGDGCSFHPRPRSTRAQSLASAGRVYAAAGEAAPNNLN